MTRILHVLSQRPGRSGSGVFLKAMVREAARAGFAQHVVAAGPASTSAAELPPLAEGDFTGVVFPSPCAPFPLPGNSDVMPYPSTVFSQMTPTQVRQYLDHTEGVLREVRARVKPDIVHAHHLWMMTAKAREVFRGVPMLATAHNVGLRLSVKAPHLLRHVHEGIRACDRICVLTPHSRKETIEHYGVEPKRIEITGAGYRDDYFFASDTPRVKRLETLRRRFNVVLPDLPLVTFIGRLSTPKGIPFLLQAVARLKQVNEPAGGAGRFKLVLVGATGSGQDGERMQERVKALGDDVIALGALPEEAVAHILRCSELFVLPSLYEGLPLVMLEAVASGCPCVISDLPTVRSWVPRAWTSTGMFHWVPQLATVNADVPVASDVDRFVGELAGSISLQLQRHHSGPARQAFAELAKPHAWSHVFARYQRIYQALLNTPAGSL